MSSKVVVIDYGLGNVHSVLKALRVAGPAADVTLAESPDVLRNADRLVLPGVGAFADGMNKLRATGLIEPIREHAGRGRPLLGICLGMQLLFSRSAEFGDHEGLGILEGGVSAIPQGQGRKVPQIGWNRIAPVNQRAWKSTLLEPVAADSMFYFVHSFTAVPREEDRLADSDYCGVRISAAVQRDSVMGCQFHPEKSGPAGLEILSHFLKM